MRFFGISSKPWALAAHGEELLPLPAMTPTHLLQKWTHQASTQVPALTCCCHVQTSPEHHRTQASPERCCTWHSGAHGHQQWCTWASAVCWHTWAWWTQAQWQPCETCSYKLHAGSAARINWCLHPRMGPLLCAFCYHRQINTSTGRRSTGDGRPSPHQGHNC